MGRPATAAELEELNSPAPKTRAPTPDELTELNAPAKKPEKSEADAFTDTLTGNAKAAADTASFNILPRFIAAGDTVAQTIDPRGPKLSEIADTYNSNLSKQQAASQKTAEEHPSASIVGSFLAPPVGKGLTAMQRLVAAGWTGALSGHNQATHTDPAAQLAGGLSGGVGGLALQGVNEASGPLAARLSGVLRESAGERALGVAGGGKSQIGDRLKKMGISPEDHAAVGNQMIDEGLIPWGLHPTKSPSVEVLERAQAAKDRHGAAIGSEINAADATGAEFMPDHAQADMRAAMKSRTPGQRNNASKANAFINEVGEVDPSGQYALNTFRLANEQKADAWKNANFKDDAPMEADQYRRTVGGLRNAIQDQVRAVNGPESAERLGAANRGFGIASDAEKLSENAVSRGNQSAQFGLPAAVMMAAGAAGGGIAGGAHGAGEGAAAATAALIGSALLKSRGPAFATRLGRTGADAAEAVANMSQNPAAAGTASTALMRYFNGMTDEEKKEELARLATQR